MLLTFIYRRKLPPVQVKSGLTCIVWKRLAIRLRIAGL